MDNHNCLCRIVVRFHHAQQTGMKKILSPAERKEGQRSLVYIMQRKITPACRCCSGMLEQVDQLTHIAEVTVVHTMVPCGFRWRRSLNLV